MRARGRELKWDTLRAWGWGHWPSDEGIVSKSVTTVARLSGFEIGPQCAGH